MENRITDLKIYQHFTSNLNGTLYGTYLCKFKGEDIIFVRNNDAIYILQHYLDKPELSVIRADVRNELFKEVDKLLESK